MLIRSQTQKKLINLSNVDTIRIADFGDIVYFNGTEDSIGRLGEYGTEGRAIEALSMIQDAYQNEEKVFCMPAE